MIEFYRALINHAEGEFDELINARQAERLRTIATRIPNWWQELDVMPKTLVHNDFNPRNIALRQTDNGLILCAYDWELAALNIPQVDLAEFLIYVLNKKINAESLQYYVNFYRGELESHLGYSLDPEAFWRGFGLAVMDFAIARLPLYLLTHTFRQTAYVPDVYNTVNLMLDIVMPMFEFTSTELLKIQQPLTDNRIYS
jgi:hypothetical protein